MTGLAGLVERDLDLAALNDAADDVCRSGDGRLVLLSGEAGIGKSALLRAFLVDRENRQRVLIGRCDALFTPRPLGPFVDVGEQVNGELGALVRDGGRPHDVAATVLAELRRTPTIVAIEDVHWADKATLDVMRLIANRLAGVPTLVIATYRDDEIVPTHQLHQVIGGFATNPAVRRHWLAPLTSTGIAELAGTTDIDLADLSRRTGGNPFFVTEVLAAGSDQIPTTVRDAVLARVTPLSPPARSVLDAVSIVPQPCEYWLLDALVPSSADHVDECVAAGALVAGPTAVHFRHELGRLAVEQALSGVRRIQLHRGALVALAATANPDFARLAHHAAAAADDDAVLLYAPQAAARATHVGAHREAANQAGRAIMVARTLAPERLGELFDLRAYSSYLSGNFPAAVDAQRQALQHHRDTGARLRQGRAARLLSLLTRYEGDLESAHTLAQESVTVLEELGPSHELGMAYCNVAHLSATAENGEQTQIWTAKAMQLAYELRDAEVEVYSLLNLATIDLIRDDFAAWAKAERALEVAIAKGFEEHAGRAYVVMSWWSPRGRSYAAADCHIEAGLRYCDEHGLDLWRAYLMAYRARADLDRGHWDRAVDGANSIIANPHTSPVPRAVAMAIIGLVRARQGAPDAWQPLDEAWEMVRNTGELQRIGPVATARAEAAWLAGRPEEIEGHLTAAAELVGDAPVSWVHGEITLWRWRAGLDLGPLPLRREPFGSEICGRVRRAHRHWLKLESPYEAALALAASTEPADVEQALAELHHLGATATAALVGRRLREQGVKVVRRGPRSTTLANPAQLTAREAEVLEMLVAGLRSQEVADHLVLSVRTVEHHVGAILRKLEVGSQREAVDAARARGLLTAAAVPAKTR